MQSIELPSEYEARPVLSLKANLWLLGIAVLVCAIFLAFSELPKNFLDLNLMDRCRAIARNAGVELLRAVVLIVNVQVLRVAGKNKYWIVLILSIISTIGVGTAIWYHHHTPEIPGYIQPDFWTSEVLNLLILAGELSLTFLIGGRGIDLEKMNRVISEMRGVIIGNEEKMNSVISEHEREMKGIVLQMDQDKKEMNSVVSEHEREMNRIVSEMKGVISKHEGVDLNSIQEIKERFDHVYSELSRLNAKTKVCSSNAKILLDPRIKISGLGSKVGVCKCSSIILADYNAQTEKECPNCKNVVKL